MPLQIKQTNNTNTNYSITQFRESEAIEHRKA